MSRSPIQLDQQVKMNLEEIKDRTDFYSCKTHSDVVDKLIQTFHRTNQQREEDAIRRRNEQTRQAAEMVTLGEELKDRLTSFKAGIGVKSEAAAVEFLLSAFEHAASVPKPTFDLLQNLR